MSKKPAKEIKARAMTWKEAYSFCAAHVLVEKKRVTRPQIHHVAIRLAAGNPSEIILSATNGQTAAFLVLDIVWLASVLPALVGQVEERWQYVDKDGNIFRLPHACAYPTGIRNVVPRSLEHRPGYGPHLGFWVFEPIHKSMKAAGFIGGEWYMNPDCVKNADGTLGEYGMGPAMLRIHAERLHLKSAWILAMPCRTNGPRTNDRILEGL